LHDWVNHDATFTINMTRLHSQLANRASIMALKKSAATSQTYICPCTMKQVASCIKSLITLVENVHVQKVTWLEFAL
jgi:3-polyprenyl-4-hydroxybenzoate decarboxylase